MKKIVLLNESERQSFLNYCNAVENMEKDKDRFLEAARLQRHEAQLSPDQVYWLKIVSIWAKVPGLLIIGVVALLFKGSL